MPKRPVPTIARTPRPKRRSTLVAQNDSRGGEAGGDDDGGDNDGSNYYNLDIHYPLLLVVRKVREYNEEMDTNAALHHLHRQKK